MGFGAKLRRGGSVVNAKQLRVYLWFDSSSVIHCYIFCLLKVTTFQRTRQNEFTATGPIQSSRAFCEKNKVGKTSLAKINDPVA